MTPNVLFTQVDLLYMQCHLNFLQKWVLRLFSTEKISRSLYTMPRQHRSYRPTHWGEEWHNPVFSQLRNSQLHTCTRTSHFHSNKKEIFYEPEQKNRSLSHTSWNVIPWRKLFNNRQSVALLFQILNNTCKYLIK